MRSALTLGFAVFLAGCAGIVSPMGPARPLGPLHVVGDDALTQSLTAAVMNSVNASGRVTDLGGGEWVTISVVRNVEPVGPDGERGFRYEVEFKNERGDKIGEVRGRCSFDTARVCADHIVASAPR